MRRMIVVVDEGLGIFVCESEGRPLWSRVDAEGECCVTTFFDERDARQILQPLGVTERSHRLRYVAVWTTDEDGYAYPRALIRAGLYFELGTLRLTAEDAS